MSLGFSYTFGLDKAILSEALRAMYRRPRLSELDLASEIGIGGKKGTAYCAWLLYLGLRNATAKEVSSLGALLHTEDPRLEDILSLQLLHYQLCSNSNATVWWTLANQVIPNTYRISVSEAIDLLKSKGIGVANVKNLHSDTRIFFSAYQTNQIFGALHYLKEIEKESYVPVTVDPPPFLLGYVLYQRREASIHTSTISIRNLLHEEGQVGKVFLLNEPQLLEKLRELEFQGIIKLSRIADLDNVAYTFNGTALDILKMYYQGRG